VSEAAVSLPVAAELSGLGIKQLRRAIQSGRLAFIPIGSGTRVRRVLPSDVFAYQRSLRQCQSTSSQTAPTSSPFAMPAYDIESLIGAGRTGTRASMKGVCNPKSAMLRVVSNHNG
jgi:hypothetical protein